MPSAMVDRQMLPRQTNKTETGSGIVVTWGARCARATELAGWLVGWRTEQTE